MLSALIVLPVSLLLLWFLLRGKKENPFPKGGALILLAGGAICAIISGFLTIGLNLAAKVIVLGPEWLSSVVTAAKGGAGAAEALAKIQDVAAAAQTPSFISIFLNTFITIALVEEVIKYLAMLICTRREGMIRTWMDALVCGAIVGLGFNIFEDIIYSDGGPMVSIMRAFTPGHFCFGVIMGYYYGKALITGKRGYRWAAVLLPALYHAAFDLGSRGMVQNPENNFYPLFAVFMMIVTVAATIVMVVKINKWRKTGVLDTAVPAK